MRGVDSICKGESIDILYGLVDPRGSQGSHLCNTWSHIARDQTCTSRTHYRAFYYSYLHEVLDHHPPSLQFFEYNYSLLLQGNTPTLETLATWVQAPDMATRYPQRANKAQLQREAQPQADRLTAPDNPHWDSKNHRKWKTDAKEHITSHFDKVSNTSYSPRGGTKGCQKHSQDVQGLGGMQLHATSQQTNDKEDEVQEYIIKPLIGKLQEMGPEPGYTEKMWKDCLGHLALPSVYEGNGTMISILQRSEPPQGYGTQFWGAFVNVISKKVNNTIRAACRTPEEKKQTSSFLHLLTSIRRTQNKWPLGHSLNTETDMPGRQNNDEHIRSLTSHRRCQR
jgi:hypothetical protein